MVGVEFEMAGQCHRATGVLHGTINNYHELSQKDTPTRLIIGPGRMERMPLTLI